MESEHQLQQALFGLVDQYKKQFAKRFIALGLSVGQPKVLRHLIRNGACTQQELASACLVDTGTMSRLLDRLERDGLIARQTSEHSRRTRTIVLEEEGRRRAEQVLKAYQDTNQSLFSSLLPEEQAQLLTLLQKLDVQDEERSDGDL